MTDMKPRKKRTTKKRKTEICENTKKIRKQIIGTLLKVIDMKGKKTGKRNMKK